MVLATLEKKLFFTSNPRSSILDAFLNSDVKINVKYIMERVVTAYDKNHEGGVQGLTI